jgi:fatty-acyl-CoA synthase
LSAKTPPAITRLKSVADATRIHAKERPDAIALDYKDRQTTFLELDTHASQVAQGLIALKQKPNARVGHIGKNCDLYFELLTGSIKARTVMVGVNWRLAVPEIAYVLNDAGCEVLFAGADFYDTIAQVLPLCPKLKTVIAMDGGHAVWRAFAEWRDAQKAKDPKLSIGRDHDVIQLYTSGTTGHPKGVQITNGNYLATFEALPKMGLVYEPDDVVLIAMPVFHVAGVNIGLLSIASGARGVVLGDIDPTEILRLIEAKGVTYAFLVPAVIMYLLQHPRAAEIDYSRLKIMSYGASPISDDVLSRAQKQFGCEFLQVYGLTETTGLGTYLPPEAHDPALGKLRSCGKPAPCCEIRVVGEKGKALPVGEVGEIQIKGPTLMKGYWNKRDATAAAIKNKWFSTGDAGFFDQDGYLYIHDRVKDMIVSGGENVYPAEVENAIFGHPAVADVAVIGIPDEKWGEAVKAMVVKKPGAEATPEEIIAFARDRIAGYKLPKTVDFIEALPRNPSGKVLRRELREPYWKNQTRRVN